MDVDTHLIADAAPGLQLRLGPDGRVRGCAGAGTSAHWLGQPFDTLLGAASRVLYQSYLLPLLQLHGQVEEFELSLCAAPGVAPVDVLLYAGRRADATIDVLMVPIRRRRRIEEELLRVKRAADVAPGMVFQLVHEADGRLHFPYASEGIRALYATTAEAAARSADAVLSRLPPDDAARLVRRLREPTDADAPLTELYPVQVPGREPQWHELQARSRPGLTGATVWHGHVADVTARHELQQARAQMQAAAQAARERSDFLARVSHELRTPLNAIVGFAHLALRDGDVPLPEAQRRRLETIAQAGDTLRHLVDEVLDVTGMATGRVAMRCSPVEAMAALQGALALVEPMARAAGVRLHAPDAATPTHVLADERRLGQVLGNLLTNAVKYNRAGGDVRVGVRAMEGRVGLTVADTGRGLSAAQTRQLFQPFNRLGAERTGTPGAGLGLVISRQLVQAMGGDLAVHSRPGQGSEFTVWLPAAAPAIGITRPPPRPRASAGAPAGAGKVLYVEDNDVNAMLMQAIVALRPGVDLTLCADGQGALTAARDDPPDLLLLDRHLPDTDGLLLLRELRALPGLAEVPAVLVSAAADAGTREAALRAGFTDCWSKPLDVDATVTGLDRLLAASVGRSRAG
jgi:signal transduction histidine kinase/ActR/RegA family two-component response regulator